MESLMVSWAFTLWESPIHLFKSFSELPATPLIPPKLPSPNNRLKAIQLSPLYFMHFIFSLPSATALTILATGSGDWSCGAVDGAGDFF